MNISGIRPSDGFYEKNINTKAGSAVSSTGNEKKPAEEKSSALGYDRDVAASLTISRAGKIAAGKVKQAVSDMEKDTTLHRYQYFVQNKSATTGEGTKGMENFSL